MIDFPIDELLDEQACLSWLEERLHPSGLVCPRCGQAERRIAKRKSAIPAYRCKACDRYFTMLSGSVLAGTRKDATKVVLRRGRSPTPLRGIAKGETTARLARELRLSRKQMHTIRHRIQANLYESLPTTPMSAEPMSAEASASSAARAAPEAKIDETTAQSEPLMAHLMEFEVDELFQNAGEKRTPSR